MQAIFVIAYKHTNTPTFTRRNAYMLINNATYDDAKNPNQFYTHPLWPIDERSLKHITLGLREWTHMR